MRATAQSYAAAVPHGWPAAGRFLSGQLGGTEDFRNLVQNPNTKKQSKLNALSAADNVQMAPLGYLSQLKSRKVAHVIRIAASALRNGRGGYPAEATPLLKSPPGTPI